MSLEIPVEQEKRIFERRGFISATISTLGAAIISAIGVPTCLYLFFPARNQRRNQWVDAGDVSQIGEKTPQQLTFRQFRRDGWKVQTEQASAWVVKNAKQVTAFGPACPHLGCAYHWDKSRDEFLCPCHGSRFSIDGKVLTGPSARPLDRYEIQVEGTRLWLGQVRQSKGSQT